jgi:PAP2 superfamily
MSIQDEIGRSTFHWIEPVQLWQRNAVIVLAIAAAQTAVYLTINHFPLFEPHALPHTWIDDAMPFWPWTLWGYYGFVAAELILACTLRDRAIFRQALIAYGIAMGITLLMHLFWPTSIVRPDVAPDGKFYSWAYRLLMEIDPPNSCFPSAHVCGPVVIFWAYWRDGGRFGAVLLFVVLPIVTLTVLTTKQHYFWDWLAAWGVGALGIGLAKCFCFTGFANRQSPDPERD